MCGIYSVLNWRYSRDDIFTKKLENQFMKGRIRGPNHTTFHIRDHKVALGFHRLAINGLDEVSNQPISSSDDKLVVICNGQIYNWRELAEKYGFKYRTNCIKNQLTIDNDIIWYKRGTHFYNMKTQPKYVDRLPSRWRTNKSLLHNIDFKFKLNGKEAKIKTNVFMDNVNK